MFSTAFQAAAALQAILLESPTKPIQKPASAIDDACRSPSPLFEMTTHPACLLCTYRSCPRFFSHPLVHLLIQLPDHNLGFIMSMCFLSVLDTLYDHRSVACEPKWDANGKNGLVVDSVGTRDEEDETLRMHTRAQRQR